MMHRTTPHLRRTWVCAALLATVALVASCSDQSADPSSSVPDQGDEVARTIDGPAPAGSTSADLERHVELIATGVGPPERPTIRELVRPLLDRAGSGVSGVTFGDFTDGASLALDLLGSALKTQDAAQITQITNDVARMEDQFVKIQQELNAIETEIQQLGCSQALDQLSTQVDQINAVGINFAQIVEDPNQYAPSVLPSGQNPYTAMAQALLQVDGEQQDSSLLLDGIEAITNALVDGQESIFASCADEYAPQLGGPQITVGAFEKDFYDAMHKLADFYYGYQVKATLFMVQYELAVLAGSSDPEPATPDEALTLCDGTEWSVAPTLKEPLGEAEGPCAETLVDLNTAYNEMVTMWKGVGTGWWQASDGLVGSDQTSLDAPADAAWVTNLNQFQAEALASDGCTVPLNSLGAACGPTVGTTGGFADDTFLGLAGWAPALGQDWDRVLQIGQRFGADSYQPAQGSNCYTGSGCAGPPLGQLMGEQGFVDTGDLIVYTGETADANFGLPHYTNTTPFMVFMDTSIAVQGMNPNGYAQPIGGPGSGPLSDLFPYQCGKKITDDQGCPSSIEAHGNAYAVTQQGYGLDSLPGQWACSFSNLFSGPSMLWQQYGLPPQQDNEGCRGPSDTNAYPFTQNDDFYLPNQQVKLNSDGGIISTPHGMFTDRPGGAVPTYRWPVLKPEQAEGCNPVTATATGQVGPCGQLFTDWLYSSVLPLPPGTVSVGGPATDLLLGGDSEVVVTLANHTDDAFDGGRVVLRLPTPSTALTPMFFGSVTSASGSCEVVNPTEPGPPAIATCAGVDLPARGSTTITASVEIGGYYSAEGFLVPMAVAATNPAYPGLPLVGIAPIDVLANPAPDAS